MPLLSIIVNFYCLRITLMANLYKTNFNKLIEMIIFFCFFSMWFHVIQAIEVNIIHLLLDVSETSIIALAGIPAGRIWPTHIYFFHRHQCSFAHTLSICFIHFSIFYNHILCNLVVAASLLLIFITYGFVFLNISRVFMHCFCQKILAGKYGITKNVFRK